MFGANKKKPADFNGGRTAQAVVQEAQRVATQIVTDRLGGKSSGGSGGGGGGGGSGGKNAVVELTDSNFKKLVMDSDDMWLVRCGTFKGWGINSLTLVVLTQILEMGNWLKWLSRWAR